MMDSDNTIVDSDAALLTGRSPCVLVDSSFSLLINAGYVLEDKAPNETASTSVATKP
jgi:hypothetical protein